MSGATRQEAALRRLALVPHAFAFFSFLLVVRSLLFPPPPLLLPAVAAALASLGAGWGFGRPHRTLPPWLNPASLGAGAVAAGCAAAWGGAPLGWGLGTWAMASVGRAATRHDPAPDGGWAWTLLAMDALAPTSATLGARPQALLTLVGVAGVVLALGVRAAARGFQQGVPPGPTARTSLTVAALALVGALWLASPAVRVAAFAALDAVAAALVALAALAFSPLALLLSWLLGHLHPRPVRAHLPGLSIPLSRSRPSLVHPHPVALPAFLAPLLLALAAWLAVALVSRLWKARERLDSPPTGFAEERLPLPRTRANRPSPPPPGIARTYALALGILARSGRPRVAPRPSRTPRQLLLAVKEEVGDTHPAFQALAALTETYSRVTYGLGPTPKGQGEGERALAALRQAFPPARRRGRAPTRSTPGDRP